MRNLKTIGGARPARRGGVLALVVAAVLAVATLSTGMLQISTAATRRQGSATNVKLAFYMAEAGLAEAYQGLSVGKTGDVASEALPARFANGLFWVVATENADGTVTLDSTGMVGNGQAELSLVVEPRLSSVASLGVFADAALAIQPGMLVDGYDSEVAAYGQPPGPGGGGLLGGLGLGGLGGSAPQPLGQLGANASIHASGTKAAPTVIDGDLTPGPGQSVTTTGKVTIKGSTDPAEAVVPLPSVSVPSYAPTAGIDHAGLVPYVILPGNYQMPFLRAESGAEIVVQGPATLVLDELSLAGGAGLELDTACGAIQIFVTDLLSFEAGTSVAGTTENTWEVSLQVPGATSAPVLLAATSQFYGVIYAPEAAVQVEAPFEVFGALVADQLTFVGPVKLHFDRHLEELAQELALPKVVSWRIVELSNPPGLTQVMNPFTYLGVTAAACPLPAEAHADQVITVIYIPLGGGGQVTYNGSESAFDWSDVKIVVSLTRAGVSINPKGGGVAKLGNIALVP